MTDGTSREDLLKLLRDHHQWHTQSGTIGVPDGSGGWIELDNAAEYGESRLYERTAAFLEELPVEVKPTPRLGAGSNHWENWQLAMRRLRIANKALEQISALPPQALEEYAKRIHEIAGEALSKTVTPNPHANKRNPPMPR